jgi:hypothetical protein
MALRAHLDVSAMDELFTGTYTGTGGRLLSAIRTKAKADSFHMVSTTKKAARTKMSKQGSMLPNLENSICREADTCPFKGLES